MGYATVARRLRLCGTLAQVRTCNRCGDPYATVAINAGCNVRACPFCARRESKERVRLVTGAAVRVSGYVALRSTEHLAKLEAKRVELAQHRPTARNVEASRKARRAAAATRAQQRGRWCWKLVTISPQYDPSDPAAFTVDGLRRRLDDVRERWRRLWSEGLGVEGLAAAYVRVELSSKGHVHLHALYFGPWQSKAWCAGVARCFVDVRRVDDEGSAIREAVKYALKAPSVLRGDWIGGDTARVMHPELAARWTIATRSKRLAEPYGVMRDAIKAAEVCDGPEPESAEPTRCASCGCDDLSEFFSVKTAEVARELSKRGKWNWRGSESRLHGALPPRVSMVRPLPKHASKM